MDIFEEINNIVQNTQRVQKLEAKIEVQQRIIMLLEQICGAMLEHEKILIKALVGNRTTLTPEEQAIVNDLHFAPLQINALADQLNAAREELQLLDQ